MSQKPNVLILGGLNTCARALAEYLLPANGESLASAVRLVDKYSVNPPTTYLGRTFPRLLNGNPNFEYRQANLLTSSVIGDVFEPPAGQDPFSYVFDFTGEVNYERPGAVQITQTANMSRNLALEAARRPSVKAYVRLTHAFYDCSSSHSTSAPGEDVPLVPAPGPRGTWWHETLRMLASIENLPLVILRSGLTYGAEIWGVVSLGLVLGLCCKASNLEMENISAENKANTVNVEDVAGAAWAAAGWIAPLGRTQANEIAGVLIHSAQATEIEGVPPPTADLRAPLFNIVDDSDLNQVTLAQVGASLLGFKYKVDEVIPSLSAAQLAGRNNHYVTGWLKIITSANPPIPNTPLSVYMGPEMFNWSDSWYSNKKIKEVVGYKLRHPHLTKDVLQHILDELKAAQVWPNYATV